MVRKVDFGSGWTEMIVASSGAASSLACVVGVE